MVSRALQQNIDHILALTAFGTLGVFWIGAGRVAVLLGGRSGAGRRSLCFQVGAGELGDEGIPGLFVEPVGNPLADGGERELAHEDVPVIEVRVVGAVGVGCMGQEVPLSCSR